MPTNAHQEIVRFNISMDKIFTMDITYSVYHLQEKKKYNLKIDENLVKLKQIIKYYLT